MLVCVCVFRFHTGSEREGGCARAHGLETFSGSLLCEYFLQEVCGERISTWLGMGLFMGRPSNQEV